MKRAIATIMTAAILLIGSTAPVDEVTCEVYSWDGNRVVDGNDYLSAQTRILQYNWFREYQATLQYRKIVIHHLPPPMTGTFWFEQWVDIDDSPWSEPPEYMTPDCWGTVPSDDNPDGVYTCRVQVRERPIDPGTGVGAVVWTSGMFEIDVFDHLDD